MNVLITSSANKVPLVKAFRKALMDCGGRVIAADIRDDVASRFVADDFCPLPASDDPAFGRKLLEECKRERVRLLIPTRDGEMKVLAALAPELAKLGVILPLPTAEALDMCLDKRAFHRFCLDNKFPVLPAVEGKPSGFPLFVRASVGAGSRSTAQINNTTELAAFQADHPDALVQPFCTDDEYTIDVLMSLEGEPLQAVSRVRGRIANGESSYSRTVELPALMQASLDLCARLGLKGHNVVQAFVHDKAGEKFSFIEVNPRFGGVSSLSVEAGLASPERLIQMAAGDAAAVKPRLIRWGLASYRFMSDLYVREGAAG
ncbi:ATP-grasp domain-containing protein [Gimibacter soli]|uniref:ATP-grasp domain-containing protein n=1 Tax=Gimibacter soli TaxID=3024400 RepID=A0AAE9XLH0_9PROT|nr:ATP-grasp domain-containing protein [Gimibacter soli]WCL53063.1 ATP-grasp domain-containing protein [Gimibacter soli]